MIFSVIIPSRNRVNNLKHTLMGLTTQTLTKDEFEIIVVDDNSTDNTKDIVTEFKSNGYLKYVFTNIPKPHTWNASVVRNLGARAADPETKAYIFVDSDVVLPTTALEHYKEDFNNNSNRVIIGPYDFTTENGDKVKYPNSEEGDVRNQTFRDKPIDQTYEKVTDGLAMFGGNLLIPKEIFWSVGGYSPEIAIGLEDGEMGIKLWKKGTKFSYDERLRGRHQWHEIPNDRFPNNMRDYIDNLNLKHFGTKDPDYGIIEASRDTYKDWGVEGWQPPLSWGIGVKDENN